MRLQIGIIVSLAVIGLSSAHPFPQHNGGQQNQNTYLPQPGQSVSQGFQNQQQQQHRQLDSSQHTFGGSEEISNLTPPAQLPAATPLASDLSGLLRAATAVSTGPQQEVTQDSYSNVRLNSNSNGVKIASALVNNNPHEYGETVPGEFSNLNSYAAYQNYQPTN